MGTADPYRVSTETQVAGELDLPWHSVDSYVASAGSAA